MSKKLVLIIILSILFCLSGWLMTSRILVGLVVKQLLASAMISAAIWLVVFLVIVFLLLGLIEDRRVIYLVGLIFILLSAFFYYGYFTAGFIYYLTGLIIFYVLFVISFETISAEKELYRKVSLVRSWKRGVPLLVTGLALLFSIIYYFHPLLVFEKNKIDLPPQLIKWSLAPMSPLLGKVLPFYDPNKTVDELLSINLASSQGSQGLNLQGIDPKILEKFIDPQSGRLDFNALAKNPEINQLVQQQLTKQAKNIDPTLLAQQRAEFAQSLGISLTGQEKIDELLGKIINSRLGDLIGPYGKIISYGVAVIVFFCLRFVINILAWVSLIIVRIIFGIFRLTKIVTIEKEMKEVEVLKI